MHTFSHGSLCGFFMRNLFSSPNRFYLICRENTSLKSPKVVRKLQMQITILIHIWEPILVLKLVPISFSDKNFGTGSYIEFYVGFHIVACIRFYIGLYVGSYRGTYLVTQIDFLLIPIGIETSTQKMRLKTLLMSIK